MRIVIAMDGFKGCITAAKACAAVDSGIKAFNPDITTTLIPFSDGSEGFLDVITPTLLKRGYTRQSITLPECPLCVVQSCDVLRRDDTYIVEMASVCGQRLYNEVQLNPYSASSYPLGLLLKELIRRGAHVIRLGLGACATHDLGIGMLSAMGCSFYDSDGSLINARNTADMRQVAHMSSDHFDELTADVRIECCYDMKNPLFGPQGATYSFAMQKGASRQGLSTLEKLLKSFYTVLSDHFGRDFSTHVGTGSAGGIGAAVLTAIPNSSLISGFDFVVDVMHAKKRISQSDLVIVGEGTIDEQNVGGKSILGIVQIAKECRVKVVALGGIIDKSANGLYKNGLTAMFSICNKPMTKTQSIRNAEELLKAQAYNIAALTWREDTAPAD